MYTVVSVLILLICVLLSLIVLVQNSKGGGLASNFSSSNQIMGVRKTTDFLEKATWALASAMIILCVVASLMVPQGGGTNTESLIDKQIESSVDPSALPKFPATKPASGAATQQVPATQGAGTPAPATVPATTPAVPAK